MKFRAKVQSNGHLFIYLPLAQCRDENVVQGSKIYVITENTGLPAEKPLKKAYFPNVVQTKENVSEEQNRP